VTTLRSTSAAVDPDWLLRWANRRRQSAADVPCARCRHRPVGPGRRQGPAAGRGYSSGFRVTDSPLYGSRQPREAATQLGYAHRRLSPPLPTDSEADGNRTQTASCHRPFRVVPLPRGKPPRANLGRISAAGRTVRWARANCAGLPGPSPPVGGRGGHSAPLRPFRGAARPPQPPDCHVRGLTEVRVRSVLREGPCGGLRLAPFAPAYHRPPSGGGAGTPFRPFRGAAAARPPQPPNCHVRGLSEVWVRSVLREGPCGGLAPIAPAYHRPPSGGGAVL
jgi:hypothetical protein